MAGAPMLQKSLGLCAVLFAIGATPRLTHAQLLVEEQEVFLKPNVRARRSGVIRITNAMDRPAEATLAIQDWHRDESGASTVLPFGASPGSCRDQLRVTPASVRIAPHETEPVRVLFEGAADRSCWNAISIESTASPGKPGQETPITYTVRTDVKVYVESDYAKREGQVEMIQLAMVSISSNDDGKVRGVEVVFRNTGAAHLKAIGALEVRNADNLVVAILDIAQFPVAPDDQRRIAVALPKLPPGRYVATALFDYSGPDIAQGETQFEVH
jgi:P pilus assembly chaperone PapD